MKKRVLSLFLVVAMLLCVFPVSIVSAVDIPEQTWSDLTVASDGNSATGYCPHCDQSVTWTLLTRAAAGHTNITESGHYFLNKTTATNGALQTNTTAGIDVVIHLNGHTLKRNGAGGNNTGALRPMVKNTTISIVDSQAQKGAIHGDYGCAFTANSQAGTTFNFYSGNLTSVATTTFNQSGGAMLMNAGTFNMYGGTINGTKAAMGGSLYVSGSAVANIYGGTIQGGTATARGGNIYMSATTATLNIAGGTIQNGTCQDNGIGGGNIYVNNGTFTISAGTIRGGKAPKGGNVYINTDATINGTASLEKGKAVYGGNLYINQKNTTLGAVSFVTGTATYGSDIYVAAKTNMTVDKSYNGTALIYYAMNHVPDKVLGGTLTSATNVTFGSGDPINRCTGKFTGKLYLENTPGRPLIYSTSSSKYLYIANTDSAALVDKSGNTVWYDSQDDAIAAYNSNTAYMIAGRQSMPLTGGDYVIDLNGHDVTITGTGSVTLFDSANADYATYGTAYVNGPTLKNTFKTTVDGNDYYMVQTDTYKYTFHRLGMKLDGVSVRTTAAGIYYNASWYCDDLLKTKIESFGVATKLGGMPKENFLNSAKTYTQYAASEFESGKSMTGVVIKNIMKSGESNNNWRSNQSVYAAPYVIFEGDVLTISTERVGHSLTKAMQILEDRKVDYRSVLAQADAFQDTWVANGVDWDYDYSLSQDIVNLLNVYDGKTAYHGEAHEHADTGRYSDGSHTLNQWKKSLALENMDFTTIVDHRQVSHMTSSTWDNTIFIGGTEASTGIDGNDSNKMHYSIIFTDASKAKTIAEKYCYSWGGLSYNDLSTTQIKNMIAEVQAAGGMFTIVHPKSSGYFGAAESALDYYFADWTGLEVFYGAGGYAPVQEVNQENYKLWTDLLVAGKKIWATAGSDKHAGASTDSMTTIYSNSSSATDIFQYMKAGNSTCGPVGIRMAVADTQMGGQTGFAGQRVIFSVDDFHESVYDANHTYSVKLIKLTKGATEEEVVHSEVFDAANAYFYATDADDTAAYYRVEVWDDTAGYKLPIAIGNPIWNN